MKVGIMSFAHIHATSYANAIQKIPNVELVAIYDTDITRGQQASEQFGVPLYSDVTSFLQQPI